MRAWCSDIKNRDLMKGPRFLSLGMEKSLTNIDFFGILSKPTTHTMSTHHITTQSLLSGACAPFPSGTAAPSTP